MDENLRIDGWRMRLEPHGEDEELFIRSLFTERDRQDRAWGGPEHDDQHSFRDWIVFICREACKADGTLYEFKRQMVQVAALAAAAYESRGRLVDKEMGK